MKNLIQLLIFEINLYIGGRLMRDTIYVPSFLMNKNLVVTKKEDHDYICTEKEFENVPLEEEMKCESEEKDMSPMEIEGIVNYIRSLSDKQIDLVLDTLPIEKIYERLGKELERTRNLERVLASASSFIARS